MGYPVSFGLLMIEVARVVSERKDLQNDPFRDLGGVDSRGSGDLHVGLLEDRFLQEMIYTRWQQLDEFKPGSLFGRGKRG